MAFDPKEYIKTQNEREAANRVGKPVEPAKPAEPKPAEAVVSLLDEDPDDEKPGKADPARSQRRRERGLLERAAKAEARAEVLQELIDKGLSPKAAEAEVEKQEEAADPEPQRKDFQDDASYNRALGRWDARQETKAELGKRDQQAGNQAALTQLAGEIAEADTKYAEDKKLIPDYDEVAQKALDDPESPTFSPAEQPYLLRRIATSDVRAFLLHHFATNPEDFKKALGMADNLPRQADFISRLEGRVEKLYSTKQAENVSEKKPAVETAHERDAKKPKPSEIGSPRGGTAPVITVSPYLADGKTLNPAWKQQQNEREHLRR